MDYPPFLTAIAYLKKYNCMPVFDTCEKFPVAYNMIREKLIVSGKMSMLRYQG